MSHQPSHEKNPDAPTLANIIKMLIGAAIGFGAIAGGYYTLYQIVLLTQTY
jgi:hypothetical protein